MDPDVQHTLITFAPALKYRVPKLEKSIIWVCTAENRLEILLTNLVGSVNNSKKSIIVAVLDLNEDTKPLATYTQEIISSK